MLKALRRAFLDGVIASDEKVHSSKVPWKICTLFETKMAKIDTLYLTKKAKKEIYPSRPQM